MWPSRQYPDAAGRQVLRILVGFRVQLGLALFLAIQLMLFDAQPSVVSPD